MCSLHQDLRYDLNFLAEHEITQHDFRNSIQGIVLVAFAQDTFGQRLALLRDRFHGVARSSLRNLGINMSRNDNAGVSSTAWSGGASMCPGGQPNGSCNSIGMSPNFCSFWRFLCGTTV